MNTSIFAFIVAVIIIGGGAYLFLSSTAQEEATTEVGMETNNTSPMPAPLEGEASLTGRAEENAVVVTEQRPGTTVIGSLIFLASHGFLVIHEDKSDAPGAIIGASAILHAGENSNVRVTLSRATRDGETLHAMLHSDVDGDGIFNAAVDTPIQSRLGGPISGWFEISSEASLDVPISI